MKKQFYCKCGFGPKDKKEIKNHVFQLAPNEAGKHKTISEKDFLKLKGKGTANVDDAGARTPMETEPMKSKIEILPAATPEDNKSSFAVKPVAADQASVETEEDKAIKPKKVGGRRWWLVWLGGGLLLFGVIMFFIYNADPSNLFLGSIFVFFLVGGGISLYFGLKNREETVKFKDIDLTDLKVKSEKGKANCLNIYWGLRNGKVVPARIAFEYKTRAELLVMKNEGRLGRFQKCRNDGNYYFVHEFMPILDTQGTSNKTKYLPMSEWKLVPFMLPDEMYFSPTEMATVITMPASKKFARPRPTKMERWRPIFLIGGAVILFLLIVVMRPGGDTVEPPPVIQPTPPTVTAGG